MDKIKGGKSDNMNQDDIAKMHKVEVNHILNQLELGIQVEFEHTNDYYLAKEIALDHLYENPNYYTESRPNKWAEQELKKEKVYEYVKTFSQFVKENENSYINIPNNFKSRLDIEKKKSEGYLKSPIEYKLKIKILSDFNYAYNRFLETLEYKQIYDENSILDSLKSTYYYFSQGKFTDLNKITFDEFISIFNSELDKFKYTDFIENTKNRIKLAEDVSNLVSNKLK